GAAVRRPRHDEDRMASVTLTPRGIGAMKPGDELWDTVIPGLHIRAGDRRRTYFLRYRLAGTQRRYKVGHHPVLTLASARDAAREVLERVGRGEDPAGARKVLLSADLTFRAMAEAMLEAKAAKTREATRR